MGTNRLSIYFTHTLWGQKGSSFNLITVYDDKFVARLLYTQFVGTSYVIRLL